MIDKQSWSDWTCLFKALTVTDQSHTKMYIGSTTLFKRRFYSHKQSFTNPKRQHDTTLSEYVWERESAGHHPSITSEVLSHAPAYRKGQRECQLCLEEKYFILHVHNNPQYLNQRTELLSKCRHKAGFTLMHAK